MATQTNGMLKMSELAERSGVSAATIKHYLREGLLGSEQEVLRTSRNMAYYPEEFVERVRLIKRLQEERFMPLRVIRDRVRAAYDVPDDVLERLEALGVLTPDERGYDADDVAIIEAISRFRGGGYEGIGFTVYDTIRYREALEPLAEEEVRVLLDRLAGKVPAERAVEIISSGAEPLRELIGAMHSKLLLAALRQRGLG
jgi:DNA-binding transcriptional MerR regulator